MAALRVQTDPLDIVALMIALLAFLVSKEVASIAGPYAAIAILACAGSALCLSGVEEKLTPMAGVFFIALRVLVAITITVALAEGVEWAFPSLKPRYTLAPIAFAIGWIRDYNTVRTWAGGLVERVLGRKVDRS